jgi:hypothetical protein
VVHRGGFTQKELYEVLRSCDLLKDVEVEVSKLLGFTESLHPTPLTIY